MKWLEIEPSYTCAQAGARHCKCDCPRPSTHPQNLASSLKFATCHTARQAERFARFCLQGGDLGHKSIPRMDSDIMTDMRVRSTEREGHAYTLAMIWEEGRGPVRDGP